MPAKCVTLRPPAIRILLDTAVARESTSSKSQSESSPQTLSAAASESVKEATPGDLPRGLKGSSTTLSTAAASRLFGLQVMATVRFATPLQRAGELDVGPRLAGDRDDVDRPSPRPADRLGQGIRVERQDPRPRQKRRAERGGVGVPRSDEDRVAALPQLRPERRLPEGAQQRGLLLELLGDRDDVWLRCSTCVPLLSGCRVDESSGGPGSCRLPCRCTRAASARPSSRARARASSPPWRPCRSLSPGLSP